MSGLLANQQYHIHSTERLMRRMIQLVLALIVFFTWNAPQQKTTHTIFTTAESY